MRVYKIKRMIAMILCIMLLLTMAACNRYPRIHYENGDFCFDSYDVYIGVEDGFALDYSHPYETAETDGGYDIILHFVDVK